jgi:murein DD-endopeptidase MepM/ murein hydrolase activator NlpD
MRSRGLCAALSVGAFLGIPAGSASAEVAHVVQPGETLWSISAANGLTTRTVAVYNGISEDAGLIAGTTIHVPTVTEGAAALASGQAAVSAPATTSIGSSSSTAGATDPGYGVPLDVIVPAPGMGHVPSPWGELHLDPAAADAWNAMREEAVSVYGVDLHPGGPLSAYRTYEQQAALYETYLNGTGAPANPPGTSPHELGVSVDVATYEMRAVIDEIGWKYGWGKVHAPGEWWHVDYVGG